MKDKIIEIFKSVNFLISNEIAEKLLKYYKILIRENAKYNLTAISDFDDVVIKHFVDSAVAIQYFSGKVLDVGSGAGFPGMVLAIINPQLNVTLVDSLNKRVNFLNMLINELDLKNVRAIHCRIEDFKEKEAFNCVTARAVAEVPTLLEYLLPFVKIGGRAILYKSNNVFSEIEKSNLALKILGGDLEEIAKFSLFENLRTLVVVKKIGKTPNNFPRGGNLPRKKPL